MRNIHFPVSNCKGWWRRIRDAKRPPARAILHDCSSLVESRYAAFLKARRQLGSLVAKEWDDDKRDALLHCYSSKTQPLRELKAAAVDLLRRSPVNLFRCPYCQIRNPRSWDHFVPQAQFPEFSVLARNWVYVCFDCNNEKGDIFGVEASVLNPYFDTLPLLPLLECVVTVTGSVPVVQFRIISPQAGEPGVVSVARRHFDLFKLNRQYQGEANSKLSTFVRELVFRFPQGLTGEQLQLEVQIAYEAVDVTHGPNSWEACLWAGVSTCADFLEAVNAQVPNAPMRRPGFPRTALVP